MGSSPSSSLDPTTGCRRTNPRKVKDRKEFRCNGYEWDFLEPIQSIDLIYRMQGGAETSMNCIYLVVDDCTERQTVKGRHEIVPHPLIVVVPHTLLIKPKSETQRESEPLRSRKKTTLMITSQQENAVGITDL